MIFFLGGADKRRPGQKENDERSKAMDKAYHRVLFLILTEYWFDKIKSGEKTHEYREARDYWNIRLAGKRFDHVCFRRGYKSKEKMIFTVKSIERKQNIPNDLNLPDVWDIELGERIA